jgi:TRAP-type uncharacterized transport system substrate-binding protein
MSGLRISRPLLSLAMVAALLAVLEPSLVGAQSTNELPQGVRLHRASPPPKPQDAAASPNPREAINAWTVGLAGGLLEGAPIRLAAEMGRVVDDGNNMHVLPIVTRGPTENVNSLLYLRGIDVAIINSDSLDEYKHQVPDILNKINYVLNLFPSELHVFVRPEIHSLNDLVGKKVNFNTLGTAAAYTGPLIFSRLGLDVDRTFIPHPVALEQMRKGENGMAAVVFVTGKPVDAFVRGHFDPGFKFLPVPYNGKLSDYYLPTKLESTDYPNLIKPGERVETVSVQTALVAFNWPTNSDRYLRVARFVDYLFTRFDKLQGAGFDPQWRAINLAGRVQGLTRFPPAQVWLDHHASPSQASQ